MAISFVAAGAVATGTNPTVAVPAGYQEADLLVLTVAVDAAVSPITPNEWTLVGSQTTTPRIYIYCKFAGGTESSLALNVNSTTTAAVMVAYRGVSETDTISTFATATATTVATNTLTTTYANEYVVSVYAMTTGAATWTAPGSTTSRVNSAGTAALAGVLIVDELQAAAGTSTARTATSSVSKALAAGSFSIIPSGRYWVGGAGTWNTTSTTNWSFSSGGASGAPAPTAQDNVFFDQASTYTVTISTGAICLDLTTSAGTVTLSKGSGSYYVFGSLTLVAGTTASGSGRCIFSSTSTGRTVTTNGVTFHSVLFNGIGGSFTLGSAFTTSSFQLQNGTVSTTASNFSITIPSGGGVTVLGGTLNLNGSTVSTSNGSFTVTGGTVNAGTSQLNISRDFSGNGLTYYNVTLTLVPSLVTSQTINGANTFNNLTSSLGLSAPGIKNILLSANQTVTGTLTLSAGTNATMRQFVSSNVIGTSRTLTCAAVASLTDIDFRDITIAGAAAPVSGTRLGDCKGNSGITFTAATTRYWNLAGNNNWSATAWAASSGASPAVNNFPLAQDTCVFEAGSPGTGSTITVDLGYNIGTINMSARTANTMTLATSSVSPVIYGNWINGTGTTITGTGTLTFAGRGSQTITSAGKTFTQLFTINSPGGSVTLQDAFTASSSSANVLTITQGTFDANTYNVTLSGAAGGVNASGTGTRTIAVGSGIWAISGTTGAWAASTSTNLTVTGTGTIRLNSASAKTFAGGGIAYTNITLDQGGAGTLTITGSNTFGDITNTYASTGATSILFTAGTTSTFTNWSANGTAGKLLTIGSVTAASHTLSKASGTVNANYLSISRSTATGGATWNALNSVDGGNNSGWIFTAPPSTGNFLMFFM